MIFSHKFFIFFAYSNSPALQNTSGKAPLFVNIIWAKGDQGVEKATLARYERVVDTSSGV